MLGPRVCRLDGLELFSQIVEPGEVGGEAEVLPGHLRPQALPQVELAVGDESEVLPPGQHLPGQPVELPDDGGERGRPCHVLLGDPVLRGHLLRQQVLVDVPARGRDGELVETNYLEKSKLSRQSAGLNSPIRRPRVYYWQDKRPTGSF